MNKENKIKFSILKSFFDLMEQRGRFEKDVKLDADSHLLDHINSNSEENFTLEELKAVADKCIAQGWLIRSSASFLTVQRGVPRDVYKNLGITSKGMDEINFLIARRDRSFLKKVSDCINEYKGLAILVGVVISAAGVIVKYF